MNSRILMKLMISLFLIVYSVSAQLYNNGHIPSGSRIKWHTDAYAAGLLSDTPRQAVKIYLATDYNIKPSNSGSANSYALNSLINTIIGKHSELVLIYFPAGSYNFSSSIVLHKDNSNLVFQGEGTNTNLRFTVGKANTCFSINGGKIGQKQKLPAGIIKGDQNITVANGSNYSKGMWIKYFEYEYPVEEFWKWPECVGQISQIIEEPSGNSIKLLEPASKDYSTYYGPYIQKIDPVKNIGIEKLKITRLDSGKPSNDPWENGNNISISGSPVKSMGKKKF